MLKQNEKYDIIITIMRKQHIVLFRLGGYIYGDKGTSAGIAQWHAGRLSNLKKFGGDKWTDLDTQLNYLWNELNGPYAKTLQALRNAKTVGEASHAFGYGFERFKGFQNPNHGNYIQRAKYANKFYNI